MNAIEAKIVRLRCGFLASVRTADPGSVFRLLGHVSTTLGKEFDCWTEDGFWRESKEPHDLDIVKWFK